MQKGYNEKDLRLGVGYAVLGTWEKASDFAGMEKRNSGYRRGANGEFIDSVVAVVSEALRLRRASAPEVDKTKQIEKLSSMFGKAAAVVEEGIELGDTKLAIDVLTKAIEHNHGKARQTMKLEKEEHHVISLPPEVETALKSLAPLLQQSGSLYVPPPMLELQEAEIVDSPDPAE